MLEVKDLSIEFSGLKAVQHLDFSVEKGEIFGLIGPNGAGKTTVFNMVSGYFKPTGGEIHLNGRPTASSGFWRSPGRWSATPAFCSWTSPPPA